MTADPTAPPALRSVARPKQARSEQTLRRLLDAAEQLIEEKGAADVAIPEIVARAGSSVGGFYARFRDKNELLRALEERVMRELDEHVQDLCRPERWVGVSLQEIVRLLVVELLRTARERGGLLRCFLVRAARDPEAFEDGMRFRRRVSERVSDLVLLQRDAIRHPDPGLAIDLGVQLAFALCQQLILIGDVSAGGRSLSDDDLADEIHRNLLAYLGVDAGEAEPISGARNQERQT